MLHFKDSFCVNITIIHMINMLVRNMSNSTLQVSILDGHAHFSFIDAIYA